MEAVTRTSKGRPLKLIPLRAANTGGVQISPQIKRVIPHCIEGNVRGLGDLKSGVWATR